jgi:thiamine biosynthesis lipoprotein
VGIVPACHRRACAALVLLVLTGSGAARGDDGLVVLTGPTMGTFYAITMASPSPSPSPPPPARGVASCVASSLARIDVLMSTWRDDSELSRFNQARTTGWSPLSSATLAVMSEALDVSRLTRGAFDPTVAPLLAVWGFGPRGSAAAPLPRRDAVEFARARVGYHRLHLRAAPPALRKTRADVALDLSAVAKGYAVDVLATLLEARGVASYLVNVGGEMRARGDGRDGAGWRVGIESPGPSAGSVVRTLRLRSAALATSGTYRRYREAAGRVIADTLDARSGAPVVHDLRSVTVIAPSAARADALATGLLVLGPVDGPELADTERVAALFVSGEDAALSVVETAAFSALTDASPVRTPRPDAAPARMLLAEVGCD